MNEQELINYGRIASAISFIHDNFKRQPNLDEIARKVHLSPFHFQRLFTEWAGVSPKKFMQYINVEYAKRVLNNQQATLFDTAFETGLSGTGRLHDHFVKIEGMTPGEFKNKGENLSINYSFDRSAFGELLIASTARGVCYMGFSDERELAYSELEQRFPRAKFREQKDSFQQNAMQLFSSDWSQPDIVKLHLKGTDFQLKVWETLLKIPMGGLTTYGNVAKQIQKPKASRAVGTAIGHNPIAFLIPCHRVIQSSGLIGGYMWGATRKTAMIGLEAARLDSERHWVEDE